MTLQTDANLTTQATTIRDEASAGANTAARVGGNLLDLADSKINKTVSASPRILGRFTAGAGVFEEGTPTQVETALLPAIVTEATTARTIAATDRYVRYTNGSATAATIPPNSLVSIPIGTTIIHRQAGAGLLTLVAGAGVTLNSSSLVSAGQHSTLSTTKVATDVWDVAGKTA